MTIYIDIQSVRTKLDKDSLQNEMLHCVTFVLHLGDYLNSV
nr:MAG TPA: hypothetical protein [Caudoviricetes sp.]